RTGVNGQWCPESRELMPLSARRTQPDHDFQQKIRGGASIFTNCGKAWSKAEAAAEVDPGGLPGLAADGVLHPTGAAKSDRTFCHRLAAGRAQGAHGQRPRRL